MRAPVDAARIRALARELGGAAREETVIYLTGGATEPMLHRYPAIDPASFRAKVERALGDS